MSFLQSTLASARFNRVMLVLGLIVLAAGAIVLGFRLTGGSDQPSASTSAAPAQPLRNAQGVAVHRFEQLDPEIRSTIRTFLTTVVPRRNIGRSWSVVAPSLKAGYTYKRWTHANALPVVFFPANNVDTASYQLDAATNREILVEVGLIAEPKYKMEPTTFQVGLVPVGSGARAKWLVDYFEPRSNITPG